MGEPLQVKKGCLLFIGLSLLLGYMASCGGSERSDSSSPETEMDVVYRHNNLGIAYMEQYDYSRAAREFQKTIEVYPEYVDGHVNLGIAYYNLGRYDEAQGKLKEALRLDPDNPHAHYTLALIYKARGEYNKAIEELSKVLKIDPDDPFAHYNLGVALAKLGRSAEAIEEYKKVIELDSDNISAHYNLASELMRSGRSQEGRKELEVFRKLKAGSPLSSSMGLTYLEQGRYAEAVGRREEAFEAEERIAGVKFVDVTSKAGLKTRRGRRGAYRSVSSISIERSHYSVHYARENIVPLVGSGGVFGDYDNDGDLDIYIVRCSPLRRESANVLYRNNGDGTFSDVTSEARVGDDGMGMGAVFGDYDNDGDGDLYVANYGPNVLYRNNGDGTFTDVSETADVGDTGFGTSAAFGDYDHDGDIDIYVTNYVDLGRAPLGFRFNFPQDFGGQPNVLYRNNSDGTFTDVTREVGVGGGGRRSLAVVFSDFDNDRDVDLYVVNDGDPNLLYTNNRDGTFTDVAHIAGVASSRREIGVAAGDYDKDGHMDLYLVNWGDGPGVLYRNRGDGTFSEEVQLAGSKGSRAVDFLDYDNDGDLDLLLSGGFLFRNTGGAAFVDASSAFEGIEFRPARGLATGDYDNDGDMDVLIVDNAGNPSLLRNDGGNSGNWLKVRMVGLGSNKGGVGSKVEVKAGLLWQKVEVRGNALDGGEAEFGLGDKAKVDLVRILWPSGVRQTELDIAANQTITVTELDRKGTSCPILYAWDGSEYRFITDILGGAIIGYLLAPGVYHYPDTDEYVKIDGDHLKARGGLYSIQFTDQLEETMYLDRAQLLAIDHPSDVEVYPNERLLSLPPYPEFGVHALRDLRPPLSAVDQDGRNILPMISRRDRIHPEDFRSLSPQFRGYASEHSIVLDLGDLSDASKVILLAYGWAEYAHSTSNLAAYQAGMNLRPPYLQVMNRGGEWQTAIEDMGFPAGLPKTMAVDLTGKFLTDDYRVKITTNMPVYWDQILVGLSSDEIPFRTTAMEPVRADLHWLGYPRLVLPDGRNPEVYYYHERSDSAPWGRQRGGYTRYGDVTELLLKTDDKYVIMSHGDEITLNFGARGLPKLPSGWERDFFFYADGFGKDMDVNSAYSLTTEPLPFHGMSTYPYPGDENYPYDGSHLKYIMEYNTRYVSGAFE